MTIQTYKDVSFPFDTEMTDGLKVRLLAAVGCDKWGWKIIGYTYYTDPLSDCSQVLNWDENGIFSTREGFESMALVPPPSAVEARIATLNAQADAIRSRLAENPNAPLVWREADERQLSSIEKAVDKLHAPHIWEREA